MCGEWIEVCPRCGAAVSWVERRKRGSRTYYYAVHEEYVGGKRRVRKCYLGPDAYTYVTITHRGVVFRGMMDGERIVDYVRSIPRMLSGASEDLKRRVVEALREVLEELEEAPPAGGGTRG